MGAAVQLTKGGGVKESVEILVALLLAVIASQAQELRILRHSGDPLTT